MKMNLIESVLQFILILFLISLSYGADSAISNDTASNLVQVSDSRPQLTAEVTSPTTKEPSRQGSIYGIPVEALISALVALALFLLSYALIWRRRLKNKEKELALKEKELQLKEKEAERERLDRLEKREAAIEAKKTEQKQFESFEERYLHYLSHEHRFLKIQGLKTRVPVSINLAKLYVPLKAYKPGETLRKYIGDLEPEAFQKSTDDSGSTDKRVFERPQFEREARVDTSSLIKETNRIAILGGPGCGKTTYLSYVALAFATKRQKETLGVERHRIPVCISCKELYVENLPTTDELHRSCIPDLLEKYKPGDFLDRNLNDGKCIILFDGLDEVGTLEKRKRIVEWIQKIANVFSDNQFIVTSRIMGYEQAPLDGEFTCYYVSDFEDEDIESFIRNWYETIEITLRHDTEYARAEAEKGAKNLIDAVFTNDRIKRLATIPQLLSIIATVHRYAGRLPENRVKLYEDCVDLLLGGKDEAIGFPLKLPGAKKLEVLKPLAYFMHTKKTREISVDDLRKEVGRLLPSVGGDSVSVDDFITEVQNRAGLLVERGQGIFAFSHLTFQEYLTALCLKEKPDAVHVLTRTKDDPWWRQTLFLYCGMTDVSALVGRLLECREDVLLGNLCLAGECIVESLKMDDQKLKRKSLNMLTDLFSNVPFDEVTGDIGRVLAKAEDDYIANHFLEMLNDDDAVARSKAALALTYIGSEKAVEPLLARLDDKDADVRGSVVNALVQISPETAVEPLLARLDDTDSGLVLPVIFALAKIGSVKAVETLLSHFDDFDRHLFALAFFLLGQKDAEKCNEWLLTRLSDDDALVRGRVASALGHIGSEKAVEPLLAQLDDTDSGVRGSVASALGVIGSQIAVEPLLARLHDTDSDVRGRVAHALGRIGSEKAVEPLLAQLDDTDSGVRGSVARALGQIGSEKLAEPLLARLDDTDSGVRGSVARALGQIGSVKAVEPLLARLNDESPSVRGSVAHALGRTGSEKAVEPLLARLHDKDAAVRLSVSNALAQISPEIGVEPLLAQLDDDDSGVRRNAVYSLQNIESPVILPRLIDKIDQKDKTDNYIYFTALYGMLRKQKVYIDQLPTEVIERNPFWKENLKVNPPC